MNQRAGKTHKAALGDVERINLKDLLSVLKSAQADLEKVGEEDAALRFEIMRDYLLNDYRGGRLTYTSKMIGV